MTAAFWLIPTLFQQICTEYLLCDRQCVHPKSQTSPAFKISHAFRNSEPSLITRYYSEYHRNSMLSLVSQSCPTLCEPITAAHPAPLSMGILQAWKLEWIAMPSSRGSSQPRNQTRMPCIACGFFTCWVTREVQKQYIQSILLGKGKTGIDFALDAELEAFTKRWWFKIQEGTKNVVTEKSPVPTFTPHQPAEMRALFTRRKSVILKFLEWLGEFLINHTDLV